MSSNSYINKLQLEQRNGSPGLRVPIVVVGGAGVLASALVSVVALWRAARDASGSDLDFETPWPYVAPSLISLLLFLAVMLSAVMRQQRARTRTVAGLAGSIVVVNSLGAFAAGFGDETSNLSPPMKATGFIILILLGLSCAAVGIPSRRRYATEFRVFAIVAVAVILGVAFVAAGTAGDRSNFPATPTSTVATATVEGPESPWNDHLPDPCAFPRAALKRSGLGTKIRVLELSPTAATEYSGARRACQLTVTPSVEATTTYATNSFHHEAANARRGKYVTTDATVFGQPAVQYKPGPRLSGHIGKECSVLVGTAFGTVTFRVDSDDARPDEELCGHATRLAAAMYPHIPTHR
ncbi:DUF3558 family protein [Gordonia crocea]|uniref:DUF3558 domain-containing protein n=1 Tax=Gordonia crocea TaxID=589162 RepID=A0A7I9UYN8_9ACTN|nr:DUF3558 family protein [Gordonia crocea]GED98016.1 hypothetical protein nbrc107697_20550 [Gordonia crocea]